MDYVRLRRRKPVTIADGPGPLPKAWRNLSGFDKLDPEEQRRHGWYPYHRAEEPRFDPHTHKLVRHLTIENGVVVANAEAVELTDAERIHRLAERRREVMAELPAIRFTHETGGIVFDGIPLHTDRESQAAIVLAAWQGGEERWKGRDGKWYPMTPERLQAAAKAVTTHKRDCFAREEALAEEIRSVSSIEALEAIALDRGWP